jgi:hypothetical protein
VHQRGVGGDECGVEGRAAVVEDADVEAEGPHLLAGRDDEGLDVDGARALEAALEELLDLGDLFFKPAGGGGGEFRKGGCDRE